MSRTSLLCGRLAQGASADEQSGFAEHGALRAHSKNGYPPKVFHKSALRGEEDSILAGEVREEIASPNRRIVGIVINAIDDQLFKGEQLDTRWSRDAIPVLPAILHEAKLARRLVVLTSDHGHVLDSNTTYKPSEGGERWRVAVGSPGEGEMTLKGSRVVIPDSKTLIAPWSENIRYGNKRNGYHGGATPQEMVTPIAVLNPSDKFPEGWEEVPVDVPAWWEESTSVPVVSVAVPPRPKAPKPTKSTQSQQTQLLFDVDSQTGPVEGSPTVPATETRWIQALFDSAIFQQQMKLAERSVPSEILFRAVLNALDQRGGRMTSAALSRSVNYPAMRLRGLLAVMQRVLNIEGFAVLTRDDASDTVDLNRELLKHQFDLR